MSWLMMVGLGVTLRAYGISTLAIVAILNAMVLIFILDGPLNLKAFEWPDPAEADEERSDNTPPFSDCGLPDCGHWRRGGAVVEQR